MAPGEIQVIKVELAGLKDDLAELKPLQKDVADIKTDIAVIRAKMEAGILEPDKKAATVGVTGGVMGFLAAIAAAFQAWANGHH